MNKIKPFFKPLFIAALILLLLAPQLSIMDLIKERDHWHADAMQNIEKSWPGKQVVAGPFLKAEYEIVNQQLINENLSEELNKVHNELGYKQGSFIMMPEHLDIKGNLQSTIRYRGIHKVPVYNAHLQIQGNFDTQPFVKLIENNSNKKIIWKNFTLNYLVKDRRGITSQPSLSWNKTDLDFLPGVESSSANKISGMHIDLPEMTDDSVKEMKFSFLLDIQGMQQLEFAQTAQEMRVDLNSNWLHPGFIGSYLPANREINTKGFTANWRSSAFSNNAKMMRQAATFGDWQKIMDNTAGVSLVQPVDTYHLSERSIKYAQLFIILTFVAMILFELFKKLRIHPIQYTFIGIELTLFYLLLISLSEHLAFALAYFLATLASTSLLTVYFSAILKDKKAGLWFGGSLSLLYAVLYGILQAEDHALLMGSLLIFGILALLMYTTRNINWYQITQSYLPKEDNGDGKTGKSEILEIQS